MNVTHVSSPTVYLQLVSPHSAAVLAVPMCNKTTNTTVMFKIRFLTSLFWHQKVKFTHNEKPIGLFRPKNGQIKLFWCKKTKLDYHYKWTSCLHKLIKKGKSLTISSKRVSSFSFFWSKSSLSCLLWYYKYKKLFH